MSPVVHQGAQRFGEPCVVEPGAAQACGALPSSCLSRSSACKRREQATPAAFAVEDAAHLVATRPVAVQVTMLEIDARAVLTLFDEADLHLRLQIRVVL